MARVTEGLHHAGRADEPIAASVGCGGHAHDRRGASRPPERPVELGVSEREHAAIGADQPVAAAITGGRHAHDGGADLTLPSEPRKGTQPKSKTPPSRAARRPTGHRIHRLGLRRDGHRGRRRTGSGGVGRGHRAPIGRAVLQARDNAARDGRRARHGVRAGRLTGDLIRADGRVADARWGIPGDDRHAILRDGRHVGRSTGRRCCDHVDIGIRRVARAAVGPPTVDRVCPAHRERRP